MYRCGFRLLSGGNRFGLLDEIGLLIDGGLVTCERGCSPSGSPFQEGMLKLAIIFGSTQPKAHSLGRVDEALPTAFANSRSSVMMISWNYDEYQSRNS
jgi:hypothetical protein